MLILVSLTLVSQLASLTYTSDQDFSDVFLPSAIALLLVTTPLAALGLLAGSKIGLGAPLLVALLTKSPDAWPRLWKVKALAAGLGLTVGLVLWLLRMATADFQPPELPELGHRGVVGGLLVSVSAAIGEEVWLRLGVMTILAWILVRALRQQGLTPLIAWVAIAISALLFAAIHLPQVAAAGAATPFAIAGTMFGNSVVSVVFGWLYWRHGIIAAITAHFTADVMLHVVPAMLG